MRIIIQFAVAMLAVLATSTFAQEENRSLAGVSVSAQGWIVQTSGPWSKASPRGFFEMEIIPASKGLPCWKSDLRINSREGRQWTIKGIRGSGYFLSDAGRIAVIENLGCHASGMPSRLMVLDLVDGRPLLEREVQVLTDPMLSTDGTRLVYRSKTGVIALDLESLEETSYPIFDLFAAGPNTITASRFWP